VRVVPLPQAVEGVQMTLPLPALDGKVATIEFVPCPDVTVKPPVPE